MRSDRIVVSMKRFIGDAVMAAPMIEALETEFDSLDIICSPLVNQVLAHPTRVRRFHPLDYGRKPIEVIRSARELRRHRFRVAVLVNHSFRSALIIRLAGVPIRIGHAAEGRNFLLTKIVPYNEHQFEAWSSLDLAAAMGIGVERKPPRIPVTAEERARGVELARGATLGVQPGARFAAKTIPNDSLRLVCEAMLAEGHRLVLLGAKEEKQAAVDLAASLSQPVVDLVGETSIRESFGVLTNLQAMVGADTGLMHMAVAVGCPTVTVFGPTPMQKWGHRYAPHQVLQAPDGDMSKLPPDEIVAALRRVLTDR